MGKGEYLGEFRHVILLAVLRLGKDAYGVTIPEKIEKRTRRSVATGAVCLTRERMENKRHLASRVGETAE